MDRTANVVRTTRETDIELALNLDPSEASHTIETDLPLLTHFLSAFAQHGGFGLTLRARGDVAVDPHHLVEDVGIALGQALRRALGEARGIHRFGQRLLPMDEALVLVALDLSGRGQLFWRGPFPDRPINGVASEVWPEFFKGLAQHGGVTLHVVAESGENAHHMIEAAFKGLGRALREATRIEGAGVPSTKGVL